MVPKKTRKYSTKQKTSTKEGKTEYQKEYMREFRKKQKEERRKLLARVHGIPEYKTLSKAKQKEVDRAVINALAMIDSQLKKIEKDLDVEITKRVEQLQASIIQNTIEAYHLLRVTKRKPQDKEVKVSVKHE